MRKIENIFNKLNEEQLEFLQLLSEDDNNWKKLEEILQSKIGYELDGIKSDLAIKLKRSKFQENLNSVFDTDFKLNIHQNGGEVFYKKGARLPNVGDGQ